MFDAALLTLIALGLGLVALSWWSQHSLLRQPEPETPRALPPVSVLKPLKGRDPALEDNLASFFQLDHPCYELVFGVQDADDPALDVVRRVCARFPRVPTRIVVDSRRMGLNPKVNNLANMLRHARYEVLLVSDSNVRVDRDYLKDLCAHLQRPGTRLVTSPIRASGAEGLGGAVESLQLNTFVMGGVAALNQAIGRPCVVGKSMMLRRSDLEAVGGLEHLVRYLAEDQVCGEDVAAAGGRIALSSRPVDNVLGDLSLKRAIDRHLRWARIRRRMSPLGYASEILANPVALSAVAAVVVPIPLTIGLFAVALGACATLAALSERRLGLRRPLVLYPALELLRSLMVAALWAVPFFSCSVNWRGHRFRIGPRTLLEPAEALDDETATSRPERPAAVQPAGS